MPTAIFFGTDAIDNLLIKSNDLLLLISPSIKNAKIKRYINKFKSEKSNLTVIYKHHGEPASNVVDKTAIESGNDFDTILAVGGGSVIDTAKAIALLRVSGGKITDYEFGEREIRGASPVYAVPSTCGSGSEVTPYTVITNSETGRKFTLTHDVLRPVEAYVDPDLIKDLPRHAMLASALDGFIHNLEALLSKRDNNMVNPGAYEGLRLVWKNLETALTCNGSEEILQNLSLASLYGGISITHSRTGLVHTMSVAFSEFSSESHGLLNAKILPFVLRLNMAHYNGKLAEVASRFTGLHQDSDKIACDFITAWVLKITASARIAFLGDMQEQKEHVVKRVLQDSGLPGTSFAPINRTSICRLIEDIINDEV